MTKSFAFFIFCWGDTPSIFILFQNLCDHFDCGLERCVLQISNITSQTNRNSHTYQEVLSEWSSDYSEHAGSQHCDVSYYVQRLWKESKQTNNKPLPLPLSAKQWKSFLRFHPRSDGRAVSLLVKGCWSCSCGSCWSAADADAGPQTQMSTLTQACCEDAWLLHAHTLLALLLLADFSVQECKGTSTGNYFFFFELFLSEKKENGPTLLVINGLFPYFCSLTCALEMCQLPARRRQLKRFWWERATSSDSGLVSSHITEPSLYHGRCE